MVEYHLSVWSMLLELPVELASPRHISGQPVWEVVLFCNDGRSSSVQPS